MLLMLMLPMLILLIVVPISGDGTSGGSIGDHHLMVVSLVVLGFWCCSK